MAHKDKMESIRIPANLLDEVRCLPLPHRTTTRQVAYLLRLGVRYHVILEKAAAQATETEP